jgi:hypothetical protein
MSGFPLVSAHCLLLLSLTFNTTHLSLHPCTWYFLSDLWRSRKKLWFFICCLCTFHEWIFYFVSYNMNKQIKVAFLCCFHDQNLSSPLLKCFLKCKINIENYTYTAWRIFINFYFYSQHSNNKNNANTIVHYTHFKITFISLCGGYYLPPPTITTVLTSNGLN